MRRDWGLDFEIDSEAKVDGGVDACYLMSDGGIPYLLSLVLVLNRGIVSKLLDLAILPSNTKTS